MLRTILDIKNYFWAFKVYFWQHMDLNPAVVEGHMHDSNQLVTELLKRAVMCVNTRVSECTQRILDAIGHTHLETQQKTIDSLQKDLTELTSSINIATVRVTKLSGLVKTLREGVTSSISDLDQFQRRQCH